MPRGIYGAYTDIQPFRLCVFFRGEICYCKKCHCPKVKPTARLYLWQLAVNSDQCTVNSFTDDIKKEVSF